MYIQLIQTITMTIATIIYSLKNIKYLSLFYGFIVCQQKTTSDDEVQKLQDHINILEKQLQTTTDHLKKVKHRITPRNQIMEEV